MRPVCGEIGRFLYAYMEAAMLSVVPWTKAEIDLLVKTVENRECIDDLATCLGRTQLALRSKAKKLSLKPSDGR